MDTGSNPLKTRERVSGFVMSGLFRPDKLCESTGLAINVVL